MKNFLPVIFVLLLFQFLNTAAAQTGWVEQTNPLGFGEEALLGRVCFVNQTEGWIACGAGGFLHTSDAGSNWAYINPFPSDTVQSFSDPASTMSWVGTTHGWNISTIRSFASPQGAVIYRTLNGGTSWDKIILSAEPGVMGIQVQFVDVNNGWALTFNFSSGQGSFFRTTDGGNNWTPQNGIGIFYFVDASNGWAYTGTGQMGSEPPYTIHKTTDGGDSWSEQFSDNTIGQYNAIRFSDLNNGWIVGADGKVLKTTNGGANWNFVINSGVNLNQSCKTVFPLDANNIWIPSKTNDPQQTPFVQYSSDGGASWSTQMTPFSSTQGNNAIFSICFINPQTGWLIADFGRIAKYTGITSIDDEFIGVIDFSLKQNYPNPFNPTTVINFTVPGENTLVTLRVYNSLGEEVSTLINNVVTAGNHQVNFDAAGFSSGVYLYTLTAGSFSDSRKMILMK